MPAASNLSTLSVPELVDVLFVKLYEPPLLSLREKMEALPEAVRILLLIADFDTEVSMNGLLGFLENSSGARLPETIFAFEAISAKATAETLRKVQRTMQDHGITHSTLREQVNRMQPYAVASFAQIHGPESKAMAEAISVLAGELYVDNPSTEEKVFDLLYAYLQPHRAAILEIASAA